MKYKISNVTMEKTLMKEVIDFMYHTLFDSEKLTSAISYVICCWLYYVTAKQWVMVEVEVEYVQTFEVKMFASNKKKFEWDEVT